MQVQVNETEYCKVHVVYEADTDAVEEKISEAVGQLRKARLPGFRPGKAPDDVIKMRCRKQIHEYVVRQMVEQAYEDAKFETKMKSIGSPEVTEVSLNGTKFSCEMDILKKPEFDLVQYKGLDVPKPHIDRNVDEQVQEALQDLRVRFGNVAPYDENDFVEMGDQVTLDFVATSDDGKEIEGMTAEGELYTIGEGRFTGFDDNLLGMMPDDEREFDLEFDQDGDLKGKTLHFKVKLHMGMKRVPAPLDDELAKKSGLKDLNEMKDKIHEIVKMRVSNTEKNMIRQQIAKQVVNKHDFQVPVWLINMEAQQLVAQNGLQWASLKEEDRDMFLDHATDNVKLSLILDSIREAEPETVLSDSEAVNALKQRAVMRKQDPEKFVVECQKTGRLHGMLAAMKDEFTMQWLVENANIVE